MTARAGGGAWAVAALAWMAALWVWAGVLLPAPAGAGKLTRDRFDSELRLGLWLQGLQVEAYRRRTGTLPPTLAAAGVLDTAYVYARTADGAYALALPLGGGRAVAWAPDSGGAAWVGPAADVLTGGGSGGAQ